MSTTDYDKGDLVRLAAAFKVSGVATDPGTIKVYVKEPDGTVTTYTFPNAAITKDSTGNYHTDWFIDQVGPHYYRWEGSGVATAAGEDMFQVRETQF